MLGWIRQCWNLQRRAQGFLHKRTQKGTQVKKASWFWHHTAKKVWPLSVQVFWFLEYWGDVNEPVLRRALESESEDALGALLPCWCCPLPEIVLPSPILMFSFPFSLPCDLLVYIIQWSKTSQDPPTPSALQLPFPGYLANPAVLHTLTQFGYSNPVSVPWTKALVFPFSQPWCSSHSASCSVNLPKPWKQS